MTVVNKLTRNRKVEVAVDADRKLISAGCAGLQHPALLRCDEALRPPCGDSSAGVRQAVDDTRWRRPGATSPSAEIAARCSSHSAGGSTVMSKALFACISVVIRVFTP